METESKGFLNIPCNLKISIYILDQVEGRSNPVMSPFLAISNSWNFFRRSPLSAVSGISSITRITQTEGWGWLEKTTMQGGKLDFFFFKDLKTKVFYVLWAACSASFAQLKHPSPNWGAWGALTDHQSVQYSFQNIKYVKYTTVYGFNNWTTFIYLKYSGK